MKVNFYNKYRNWFALNASLRKVAQEFLAFHPVAFSPKDYIAVFALAKAFKTHDAAMILFREGFGEDAGMLIRTLFELDLLIKNVLIDESDATAELFIEYGSMERKKMYNANSKTEIRDMMKLRSNYQEIIEQMKKDTKAAIENPQRKDKNGSIITSTWSGKSYDEMAKLAKLDDSYNIAYRLFSQLTHSNPRVVSFYLYDREDAIIETKEYPTENWINEGLVKAFDFLYDIVHEFNKHFSRKKDKKLEQILKRYIKLLDKENASN